MTRSAASEDVRPLPPAIRRVVVASAAVSVVSILGYALVAGGIDRPAVLVATLAGGVVLAAVGAVSVATSTGPRPSERWLTLLTVLGLAAAVVIVTVGLGADPRRFTLLFVLVIAAGVVVLPPGQREVVSWSAVTACAAATWLGSPAEELRQLAVLVPQVGGTALAAYAGTTVARALERAASVEADSRPISETRVSLLATVLRLQALEPDAVLTSVVTGANDAGFDLVSLHVVEDDELRLAVSAPPGAPSNGPAFAAAEEMASIVHRTGQPLVVGGGPQPQAAPDVDGPIRAAIVVPILVDGQLVAVLTGGSRQDGIDPLHREAAELLAAEAGKALGRATRYAADAAAVVELRRLDEVARDFVSTVSHELRTPLTVVNGLAATLAGRWDDLEPERRQDLLRRVGSNAERLNDIVRSLLDTSALEAGRLETERRPVDVGELVRRLLERLAPLLTEHRFEVIVPDDAVVEADPGMVEHVLENLVTNAVKHTPSGTEVVIAVTDGDDDEVEVSVQDSGPGIPPEELPHVTERFYRGGPPTRRATGGLGLGLAIVVRMLRAHDRELTVTSDLGAGTRFSFHLPRASP